MLGNTKELKLEYKVLNSDFNKSIKEINNQVRSLNKEFRNQREQTKLSSSSYDKLQAKVEQLNKQYDLAKQKTEQTRKAYENAKNTLGENSKEAQKWGDKLQDAERNEARLKNQLTLTTAELERQTAELKKQEQPLYKIGEQFQAMGQKLGGIGDKMKGFGETLSKKITAPLTAFFGASAKGFSDVKAGTDNVATATGAMGDELKAMQDVARDLATELPASFADAGAAVGEVNTKFGYTGDQLHDLSEKALKFAAINGTDVSDSIDDVSNILKTFNLESDQAGLMFDLLSKAGQDYGADVGELSRALRDNARSFDDMGLSAQESVIFLGQVHQAGLDVNTAVRGLRKANQYAAREGKTTNEVLKDFSDYMESNASDADKTAKAIEIFGVRGGTAIAQFVKNGQFDIESLLGSVEEADGVVENTFENIQGPGEKFKTVLNQIKDIGYEVGGALADVLIPVMDDLKEKLKSVGEKWKNLDDSTKETIVKAGLIAAAIGPVVAILGAVVKGLSNIFTGIGAFAKFASANPVVLAIMGIVAAVVAIITHLDWFKEKFGQVKDKVVQGWETIKAKTEAIFGPLAEFIKATWQGIKDFLGGIVEGIVSVISGGWERAKNWTHDKFSAIYDITSNIWTGIKDTISGITRAIGDKVSGAWDSIKSWTSSKFENVRQVTATKWQGVKNKIVSNAEAAKNKVSGVWGSIASITSNKWNAIKDTIGGAMRGAFNAVGNWIQRIKNKLSIRLPHPHIPLPHFSVSGKFSLKPLQVPRIHVDWYKQGGVLQSPTLFGSMGNRFLGGGEAGPEAVIPLKDSVLAGIGRGIADNMPQPIPAGPANVYITMNNNISSDYDSDRAIRRLDEGLGRLGVIKSRGAGRA